jgi:glycine dehydrogenase subunit 1
MRYLANAPADVQAMLDTVGAKSLDELFSSIPKDIRFNGTMNLMPAKSEQELISFFEELAAKNTINDLTCF